MEKNIQDLVAFVVGNIIDKNSFTTRVFEDGDRTIIELTISKENIGKIIGKQGRVISAIRTVASAAAFGSGARFDVTVEESDK